MNRDPVRIVSFVLVLLIGALAIAYVAGLGPSSTPDHDIDTVYDAAPDDALRVLFVGNSHTYRHDVPGQVQRFGQAAGTPIWVEQEVAGGASLEQHWKNTELRGRIVDGDWDVVVLQEHSLRPALEPEAYLRHVEAFCGITRRAGAEPLIYATWARARWSPLFGANAPVDSPGQLRAMLEESFRKAAEENDARVAPVGTAWMAFRRRNAAIPLHVQDGNHATAAGAYLAAAVLYRVITDSPVADVDYRPEAVSAENAAELRRIADASLQRWAAHSAPAEEDAAEPGEAADARGADAAPAAAE